MLRCHKVMPRKRICQKSNRRKAWITLIRMTEINWFQEIRRRGRSRKRNSGKMWHKKVERACVQIPFCYWQYIDSQMMKVNMKQKARKVFKTSLHRSLKYSQGILKGQNCHYQGPKSLNLIWMQSKIEIKMEVQNISCKFFALICPWMCLFSVECLPD